MPPLPSRPSFSLLKKQAKELRKAVQSGQAEALRRVQTHHPNHVRGAPVDISKDDFSLRDAQLVIAREYGYDNWLMLKEKLMAEAEKEDAKTARERRIQQQTSSEEEIERIVTAACGSPPVRTERITVDFSCEVHRVETEDGRHLTYHAIWFCGASGNKETHFENEKWALEQCARVGVPAPEMLYIEHGLPGYPKRSVCVLTYLEGQPLKTLVDAKAISESEFHRLLFEVGKIYGELHQVRTEGFGQIDRYGRSPLDDWQSGYLGNIDMDQLRQAAENTDVPWPIVEERLQLLADHVDLCAGVEPCLVHGGFGLKHFIVHEGQIAGLIDFEHCRGGDPANELMWHLDIIEGWWDWFNGQKSTPFPTKPLLDGYRETGSVDETFMQRSAWYSLWGSLQGLRSHGVNNVNVVGMMPFLNRRFQEDLELVQQYFG